jgi:hypothetical protein
MRRFMILMLAALLLPAVLAAAPAKAETARAGSHVAVAHGYGYDPIVGNWYRGDKWFKVRPARNGVYRVSWSNGSGPRIRYKIQRRSATVWFETANHRNTYRIISSYQLKVHYLTTEGRYITRVFERVG